jgi:hypothetical protein
MPTLPQTSALNCFQIFSHETVLRSTLPTKWNRVLGTDFFGHGQQTFNSKYWFILLLKQHLYNYRETNIVAENISESSRISCQ